MQSNSAFGHLSEFQKQYSTSVSTSLSPSRRAKCFGNINRLSPKVASRSTACRHHSPRLSHSGRRIIQQFARKADGNRTSIAWGLISSPCAASPTSTESSAAVAPPNLNQVPKGAALQTMGFGEPRGFGSQWIGMTIAGCILNVKPVVKKQPPKPVLLKTKKRPRRINPARGLVQRLRSLTSKSATSLHKPQESRTFHIRMQTGSGDAGAAQQTCPNRNSVAQPLGARSARIQLKAKPKRKVLQPKAVRTVDKKPAKAAKIDERARLQQEIFQKKTQERVWTALRAQKKEAHMRNERQPTVEPDGSSVGPEVLLKKTQERIATFKAKHAKAELKAASQEASRKQFTIDVAEHRERARLRAKEFLRQKKAELNEKKKQEVETKLLKSKLRQDRINKREQRRAEIYAINALMKRWNLNQMKKFDADKARENSNNDETSKPKMHV